MKEDMGHRDMLENRLNEMDKDDLRNFIWCIIGYSGDDYQTWNKLLESCFKRE